MAFAGLTITSHRETVVDFSVPFWYETSSVAVHVSMKCKLNLTCREISLSIFVLNLQPFARTQYCCRR